MSEKLMLNESVVCATLDDEAVLLNVETGIYYGLDSVGTRIWSMVALGATESDIIATLTTEYEVELRVLQQDVADFVMQLVSKGLVKPLLESD